MKKILFMAIAMTLMLANSETASARKKKVDLFPDGTPIPAWFSDTTRIDHHKLGKEYVLTDYGVKTDSTIVQTEAIQRVIDLAAKNGGGVIVVKNGTFLSGSLFFRQGTHLHVCATGKLKGSDRIRDFKLTDSRMEGQNLKYFSALVNADGLDGFTISGKGTIDGNGYNYWEEFWIRRNYNRQCTNLEAMRPRLVYISNSKNVTVQDVHLQNSPFWTNHLYKCDHVRYLNCYIYAPTSGMKAPSSDAIDIDVCHDVLINGCYMSVNDDAVAIKGGKGTWADKDANNGPCYNIIIQNCRYGVVHGCLTLGSESLHDRNIILRNINMKNANRVLWLKMRPDTPQHYEYVTVDNITGTCNNFLVCNPWTQFFKPEKRDDMPLSQCNNITIKNCNVEAKTFFNVKASDKYKLNDFTFDNLTITGSKTKINPDIIENCKVNKVTYK